MAVITLSQNKQTEVDEVDLPLLSMHTWYAVLTGRTAAKVWYAATSILGMRVYMHRLLIGENAERVDHCDGDGLNNRRVNLRACTHQQNLWNQRLSSSNTTGFKGVCFDKNRNKWHCSIGVNGRMLNIGRFDSPEAAAMAYDMKAVELRGEFARLNFENLRSEYIAKLQQGTQKI